jgi:hypothetical protein
MRPSGIFTTFTTLALSVFFVLGVLSPGKAAAQTPTVVGTYFLDHTPGDDCHPYKRTVQIFADGNFVTNSQDAFVYGFGPAAQGRWTALTNTYIARAYDFEFDLVTGQPTKITQVDYCITLNAEANIAGTLCGTKTNVPPNKNPLENPPQFNCEPPPSCAFSCGFTGLRLTIP